MSEGLHPSVGVRPGQWYACSQPERPSDDYIIWEEECPRCRLKAAAQIAAFGDEPLVPMFGHAGREIMLSDIANSTAPRTL